METSSLPADSSLFAGLTRFFISSIGKKFAVALTGISLVGFLLEHMVSNMLLLLSDPAPFLAYAHFMGTNLIIRILEIGLFAGFALHIVFAAAVTLQNRKARPVRYDQHRAAAKSFFSRTMAWTGSVTFIFLAVHLGRFFVPHKLVHTATVDLHADARLAFSNPWYVAFYVVAMGLLAFHLNHGFQSAFQTFGLSNSRFASVWKRLGVVYAIVVPGGLALIPLVLWLQR
jgi:succinate dehydrogenase / fumarate reductase cytochrome b subunit